MKPNHLTKLALALAAVLPLSAYGQTNVVPTAAPSTPVAASPSMGVPSNVGEVIKLSSAGLGNDVVMSYVNGSQSLFNLSANDIVHLKDSGVSPQVITAMLNHDQVLRSYNPYGPGGQMNPTPTQTATQPQQPPVDPNQAVVQQPAPTTVVVQQPPQVQYVPVSPGPDYYWSPGYYGVDGVWIGGGWLRVGFGYGWGGFGGWGPYYGHGYGWRGGYGYRGGFHGGGGFHGHR